MSDLTERLWASDAANSLTNEAARALESQEARIAVMIAALESAKEELYFVAHSGCDPDDSSSMDSVAVAYRECRDALTPPLK